MKNATNGVETITLQTGVGRSVRLSAPAQHQHETPEATRRERVLRGIGRLAEEAAQDGRGKAATEAQALRREAARYDEQLLQLEAELAATPVRTLPAAARAAGEALRKTLPGCFADVNEAAGWAAGNLPLTAARKADHDEAQARLRADRERHAVRRCFWRAASGAAVLVARHNDKTCADACLDEAERAGKYL